MNLFANKRDDPDKLTQTITDLVAKTDAIESRINILFAALSAFVKEYQNSLASGYSASPGLSFAIPDDKLPAKTANDPQEKNELLSNEITRAQKEKEDLTLEVDRLTRENAELKAKNQTREQLFTETEKKNSELSQKLSQSELSSQKYKNELENLSVKLREYETRVLPDGEILTNLWERVENLPQAEKNLLAAYYNLSSIAAFLTGAGQFTRLEQLWDAGAKKIAAGVPLPQLGAFMETLVNLYNRANPDSKAALLKALPGDNYDYSRLARVGKNGAYVENMLFPGLIRPNGALEKKGLVSLK